MFKRDGLTPRQRSVLFALLLLRSRDEWVRWSTLDQCFDGLVLPIRETMDHALAELSKKGFVVRKLAGNVVIAVRLTASGRRMAESINMLRVVPLLSVNPLAIRRGMR